MKRRQKPSLRQSDVEEDKDDIWGAFHGRSKSVPSGGVRGVGMDALRQQTTQPLEQGNSPENFLTSS